MQSRLDKWYELIRPTTVNIILGKKRKGKSALAYFLLEAVGQHYGLQPVVVNLPAEKQSLLPEGFLVASLESVRHIEDSVVLIDEGTTMLPAGQARLEEMVKGFQALSGQRNQIIFLIFHASADVGSRILRGVDAVLLKEPSKRQIQHGSKDSWWQDLLSEAKGKFKIMADAGEDVRRYTYIDSEEPEFRGFLSNSLCSFWSEELSRAWAGTGGESICPQCRRKVSRLIGGLCISCYRLSLDEAQLRKIEKKTYMQALNRGDITTQEARKGILHQDNQRL